MPGTRTFHRLADETKIAQWINVSCNATIIDHVPFNLSAELAIRFEKAFGVKADTLLRMQMANELAQARAHEAAVQLPAVDGRPLLEHSGILQSQAGHFASGTAIFSGRRT